MVVGNAEVTPHRAMEAKTEAETETKKRDQFPPLTGLDHLLKSECLPDYSSILGVRPCKEGKKRIEEGGTWGGGGVTE